MARPPFAICLGLALAASFAPALSVRAEDLGADPGVALPAATPAHADNMALDAGLPAEPQPLAGAKTSYEADADASYVGAARDEFRPREQGGCLGTGHERALRSDPAVGGRAGLPLRPWLPALLLRPLEGRPAPEYPAIGQSHRRRGFLALQCLGRARGGRAGPVRRFPPHHFRRLQCPFRNRRLIHRQRRGAMGRGSWASISTGAGRSFRMLASAGLSPAAGPSMPFSPPRGWNTSGARLSRFIAGGDFQDGTYRVNRSTGNSIGQTRVEPRDPRVR